MHNTGSLVKLLDNLFMSQTVLDNLYHKISDIRHYPVCTLYHRAISCLTWWMDYQTNTGAKPSNASKSILFKYLWGLGVKVTVKAGNDAASIWELSRRRLCNSVWISGKQLKIKTGKKQIKVLTPKVQTSSILNYLLRTRCKAMKKSNVKISSEIPQEVLWSRKIDNASNPKKLGRKAEEAPAEAPVSSHSLRSVTNKWASSRHYFSPTSIIQNALARLSLQDHMYWSWNLCCKHRIVYLLKQVAELHISKDGHDRESLQRAVHDERKVSNSNP